MSENDDRGEFARYQMFSKDGNDEVERHVASMIQIVAVGTLPRTKLPEAVNAMCREIASRGYPEVWDTEPQEQIAIELTERACKPLMWQPISRWEW